MPAPKAPLQALAVALLAAGAATLACADATTPEATVKVYLDSLVAGLPGRAEVVVGQLDPRLTLAPCARIEPYLPANTRLWGRSHIGLRCVEGASWNVSLPVNVRLFGPALVAVRALPANQPISEYDVALEEQELTREPGAPLNEVGQLGGRVLSRPVAAGTVLRQDWLRAQPVIQAGDNVRILARGAGFAVTGDGQALNSALDGQTVRVRTDSGRVVTGTARPGRTAEILL